MGTGWWGHGVGHTLPSCPGAASCGHGRWHGVAVGPCPVPWGRVPCRGAPWGRVLCYGAGLGGPFPGRARRLLPQFVPFRDYVDDSGNQVLSMARLAKDVLAEIPEQLLSYMKTRDIKPRRTDPQ